MQDGENCFRESHPTIGRGLLKQTKNDSHKGSSLGNYDDGDDDDDEDADVINKALHTNSKTNISIEFY